MKMTRRVLALLLALCLTFGNVMPAMATGLEGEEPVVTEETTPVVPEVEEPEAPAEAEETEAPVAEETEAPAEVEETEAPVVETEAPVVETEAPVEEEIGTVVDETANAAVLAATLTGAAENRTSYSTSQQIWEANGIKLTNDKGSSTSNVGDYKNPIRLYKSSTVTIEYTGMTKVVFTCVSGYVITDDELSAYGSATTNGAVVTLVLDEAADVITFQTTAQRRIAQLDVYTDDGVVCNHNYSAVVTAPTCTAAGYTTYTCSLCGDSYPEEGEAATGHTKGEDGVCTVCGDGTVLSIAEAIALGESTATSTYTEVKYVVSGEITEIQSTTYGNMMITDGTDSILIYGVYSADGSTRYDKMETQPVVGDTVKFYGVVGNYKGTAQMQNGWLLAQNPTEGGDEGDGGDTTDPSEPTPDAPSYNPEDAEIKAGVAYKFGMIQEKVSATDVYYITGAMSTYYMATTTDVSAAADVYVEVTDNGFYLYTDANGSKQYINMVVSSDGAHVNGAFEATASTVYTYDNDKDTLIAVVDGADYWFGTRNDKTYTTVGPCKVEYEGFYCKIYAAEAEEEPAEPVIYFDNTVAKWDAVDVYLENNERTIRLDCVKEDNGLFRVVFDDEFLEYMPLDTITKIGFCEHAGGGYTSTAAFENGKTYNDLTITDESITVYWDNSVLPLDEVSLEISCAHGGYEGPMVGHMGGWAYAKSVNGDIYEFEIPACTAGCPIWFANEEYIAEDGKTYPTPPAAPYDKIVDGVYETNVGDYSTVVAVCTTCEQPVECHYSFNWVYSTAGEVVWNKELNVWTCDVTVNVADVLGAMVLEPEAPLYGHAPVAEIPETITATYQWNGQVWELVSEAVTYEYVCPGTTAQNPIDLTNDLLYENDFSATVAVPAGATYYYSAYRVGGMLMSINGGEAVECVIMDMMSPYAWAITNEGDADAEYVITVSYPVGAMENPAQLVIGENVASVAAGNNQGYYYTWTAPVSGKLSVEISAETGWTYAINNMTTYQYGDSQWSDSDPVVNPAEIDVAKGDEIQIMVNTYDPADMWSNPAGDVTLNVSIDPLGSETNPIYPEFVMNEKGNAGTATVTVPANTTYNFASWNAGGMLLTINDGEPTLMSGNPRMPVPFSITNDTDADAEYVLHIAYPVGHMMNPAELVNDENVTTIEAGNDQGYFYSFVAESRGTLTLEIVAEAGWTYQITNVTAGVQDDIRWSDDEEVANPVVIDLLAGEEIQIMVNTYDPENPYMAPGGEVTINASFEASLGSDLNPDTLYLDLETIAEIPEGIDYYLYTWTADYAGELIIDVSNGKAGWSYEIVNLATGTSVKHNSAEAPAVNTASVIVSAGDQVEVKINTCGEHGEVVAGEVYFTATFEPVVGTVESPIDLTVDLLYEEDFTATVTIPAGETYYFMAYNVGGMFMSINGSEPVECVVQGMGRMPYNWTITNDGETDAEYVIALVSAPGTMGNPEKLVLGENTATVEAGSQGYFYTWTAEEDGTLTVTMPEGNWFYYINNLTAEIYGDWQWSDSDPVVNSDTIEVSKGDEIQISVNTYDPNAWEAPAGSITFTAEFAKKVGTAKDPDKVTVEGYGQQFKVILAPGESYYYEVNGADGMLMMAVTTHKSVSMKVNGKAYTFKPNGEDFYYLESQLKANIGEDGLKIVFTNKSSEHQHAAFGFFAPYGAPENPKYLTMGKNSVKLAAGDEDGYTYGFRATGNGYLTITMNSTSNWLYSIDVIEETGENVYSNTQSSSDEKPVKSRTIFLSAGELVFVNVNTANGNAGTVTFTAAFANKTIDLMGGKSTTLSVTHPDTGKKLDVSKFNFEIVSVLNANGEAVEGERVEGSDVETWPNIATVNAKGKFTAKAVDQFVSVLVKAVEKNSETDTPVENYFRIEITPVASAIKFDQYLNGYQEKEWVPSQDSNMEMWIEDETLEAGGYWQKGCWEHGEWKNGWKLVGEDLTTINYVANGDEVYLKAVVGPEEALQDVTWKSSNTKILKVESRDGYEPVFDEEGNHIDENYVGTFAYLEPVINTKTGKYATGTVTLTATAKDGSGVKATIKVNVSVDADYLNITTKNHQRWLGSNKSMTLTATPKTSYDYWPADRYYDNISLTNKAITWSMMMMVDQKWIEDPENGYEMNWIGDWEHVGEEEYGYWSYGYWESEYAEVPADIATLSQKGVLKAGKNLDQFYHIVVKATTTNADGIRVVGEYGVTLWPAATSVEIVNVPKTWYLNDGTVFYPEAKACVSVSEDRGYSTSGVKWTSSNTKIAKVVSGEYDDWGNWYEYDEPYIEFTGKLGKVTLTATATDGSNVKKSVTMNVAAAPDAIEMIDWTRATAGKALTIKAAPYYEAYDPELYMSAPNYTVSDKTIIWSFADKEAAKAIGAKISKGVLTTNAKLVKEPVELEIIATTKMENLQGEQVTRSCFVTVYPATTKVTLYRFGQPISGTLTIDDDNLVVLHAEGEPTDDYTWKSSNTKIATVKGNADGSVTIRPAGKLGKVTITATANDGTKKSAKLVINVVKKVDVLTVAENVGVAASKSINLNNFLTINPTGASNKKVTWSWADAETAAYAKELKVTLNSAGTLSAKNLKNISKPVTLEVRVTAADGFGAYTTAMVTVTPATTKVELYDDFGYIMPKTGNTVSYKLGELQLSAVGYATIVNAEGKKEYVSGTVADQYKWTSSNAKIATVDKTGKVTFTGKVGSVTIKATALDGTGKYAQTTIKVVKYVENVTLKADHQLSLVKGKSMTLSKYVTFEPADATTKTLKWSIVSMKQWNPETQAFDLEAPGAAKFTDTKKGILKADKATDLVEVVVRCDTQDYSGKYAETTVILAPKAVKDVKIMGGAYDEYTEWVVYDYLLDGTDGNLSTMAPAMMLYPEATNSDCYADYTVTLSNKAYKAEWKEIEERVPGENEGETIPVGKTSVILISAVDPQNATGNVKVTITATDGGKASSYVNITFGSLFPAT